MPGKVKVRIVAGRNLPVMDRSSDTTDAFVEVKLGSTTFKTEVFRKSLNPQWNSEWFKFEVDDEELQDEPLQIRIMDHDTYSAHDAIGKVYIDLNPLLAPHCGPAPTQQSESSSSGSGTGTMLSGWFPVFDTMHGVRGEIFVVVKVELFSDVNRFRQSSCGVRFFNTPSVPVGYNIVTICGFVEELVVNDDPEYQWIDKIRTQRSSNEARQTLFLKLSGEVRRRIGLKTLELGGNAVIGYKQYFDLEGESGIVVRGIGTVANLHINSGLQEQGAHGTPNTIDLLFNSNQACATPQRKITPKTRKFDYFVPSGSVTRALSRPRRSVTRPGDFLTIPGTLWGSPLKTKILSFIRRFKKGFADNPQEENEVQGEMSGLLELGNFENKELRIVEEQVLAFDCHSIFPSPVRSQESESKRESVQEPMFFVTSSESECSSICSSDDEDLDSPDVYVTIESPACFPDLASQSPFEKYLTPSIPSPISRRSRTLPNLCQCPSSMCSGITCVSVPNPVTNRIERYGSPSNPKLMKLPVVKKKSSESDLSITPKGLSGSAELHTHHLVRQLTGSQHIYDLQHEMSEYPFLTLSTYPKHFISHIGGTVSARSVKLLDRITNPDEPETRDAWWAELRMEVRSHARALGCTFVLGYTEQTSICDEVCILSSSGTAAVVDFQYVGSFESRTRNSSGPSGPANLTTSFEREKNKKEQPSRYSFGAEVTEPLPCAPCHVPYNTTNIPCPVKLSRCNTCRKHKVPDVLLATIEIPKGIPVEGRGCLVQARVGRAKREYKSGGDSQAREVSDALPFLEYELHRQLLAKLRIRGMNAIFGLHVQVSIGEKHIIGLATGTAIYLSSLPPGRPPAISSTGNKEDQLKVAQMSKKLKDVLVDNRDYYGIKDSALKPPLHVLEDEDLKTSDQSEDSDDELPDIHLVGDNKDTCILEIDDPSELDIASVLTDDRPPKNFYSSTTELQPGMNWRNLESNYLSFTRVWQGRGPYPFTQKQLDDCFNILLQGLYFQLRKAAPCLISGLRFAVDLPDEETIQITICGMASRLQEDYPNQTVQEQAPVDSSMIFKLEDDPSHVNGEKKAQHRDSLQSTKQEAAVRDHPVVEITPLSQVPGTEIKKYLGNLNFFFVRESTSIRESGGLSAFVASFIGEVFAIARAHVAALGGNAMVAYTMSQYILVHNPHKNQGQCLINASGDAVFLSEASEK